MTAGYASIAWDDDEVDVAVHAIEVHIGSCQEMLERVSSTSIRDVIQRKVTIMWSLVTSLREAQTTARHEREGLGMDDPPRELSKENLREASEASD